MVVTHWAQTVLPDRFSKSIGTRSLIEGEGEGVAGYGTDEAVRKIVGEKDGFWKRTLHEARL